MSIEIKHDIQTRVSFTRTGVKARVIAFVMGLQCELTPNDVLKKAGVEILPGEHWYVVYYDHDQKWYSACKVGNPDDTVAYEEDMAYLITRSEIPEHDGVAVQAAIEKGIYAYRTLVGSSKPIWIEREH
ncbi:MAG: hypothetical protein WC505_01900 [Patescibacteria group bacterium]